MTSLPPGHRLYDEEGVPISATNPLEVSFPSDPLTITVDVGSLVDTNYSNMQKIVNATDYIQTFSYSYHTTTAEYYVSSILHASTIASLTATESLVYTGTGTVDFRILSIGLS